MDCTTLSFSPNTLEPIPHTPLLYYPAQDEFIYSSLDLSFQANVSVSCVDRKIIDNITRDRIRISSIESSN